MAEEKICACHKYKERTEEESKQLIHRLNRIEGQIRGIRGMVEKNIYCTDILMQVAAANAALNAFTRELLGNHIRTCVAEDIRSGKDETIDELLQTLQKLRRRKRSRPKPIALSLRTLRTERILHSSPGMLPQMICPK